MPARQLRRASLWLALAPRAADLGHGAEHQTGCGSAGRHTLCSSISDHDGRAVADRVRSQEPASSAAGPVTGELAATTVPVAQTVRTAPYFFWVWGQRTAAPPQGAPSRPGARPRLFGFAWADSLCCLASRGVACSSDSWMETSPACDSKQRFNFPKYRQLSARRRQERAHQRRWRRQRSRRSRCPPAASRSPRWPSPGRPGVSRVSPQRVARPGPCRAICGPNGRPVPARMARGMAVRT
jgi:hypothetical protein